jgi:hypothetical protein
MSVLQKNGGNLIKIILFLTTFSLSLCARADIKPMECKDMASVLRSLAEIRDNGLPVKDARQLMYEMFASAAANVRNTWVDQVDNIYSGKLKGLSPGQIEMITYNICTGRMAQP